MVVAVGAGAVVSEFVAAVVTTVMVSVDSVLAPVETLTYFFFWTFLLFWDMVACVSYGADEIIDFLCLVCAVRKNRVVGVLKVQGSRVKCVLFESAESKNFFKFPHCSWLKFTVNGPYLEHFEPYATFSP